MFTLALTSFYHVRADIMCEKGHTHKRPSATNGYQQLSLTHIIEFEIPKTITISTPNKKAFFFLMRFRRYAGNHRLLNIFQTKRSRSTLLFLNMILNRDNHLFSKTSILLYFFTHYQVWIYTSYGLSKLAYFSIHLALIFWKNGMYKKNTHF